jgi:hypothetical protein
MNERTKALRQLREIATVIDSHPDWWRFPTEGPVQGFLGTDPLFIVGDQPSTSAWEATHPKRRAFYDPLPQLGAANAHITDLYKRRGKSGALRHGLPEDFDEHLELFRREIHIMQPARVVAIGHVAYRLLARHVPEIRSLPGTNWSACGPPNKIASGARRAVCRLISRRILPGSMSAWRRSTTTWTPPYGPARSGASASARSCCGACRALARSAPAHYC